LKAIFASIKVISGKKQFISVVLNLGKVAEGARCVLNLTPLLF